MKLFLQIIENMRPSKLETTFQPKIFYLQSSSLLTKAVVSLQKKQTRKTQTDLCQLSSADEPIALLVKDPESLPNLILHVRVLEFSGAKKDLTNPPLAKERSNSIFSISDCSTDQKQVAGFTHLVKSQTNS